MSYLLFQWCGLVWNDAFEVEDPNKLIWKEFFSSYIQVYPIRILKWYCWVLQLLVKCLSNMGSWLYSYNIILKVTVQLPKFCITIAHMWDLACYTWMLLIVLEHLLHITVACIWDLACATWMLLLWSSFFENWMLCGRDLARCSAQLLKIASLSFFLCFLCYSVLYILCRRIML